MVEEWRVIRSYANYEVSDNGRVRRANGRPKVASDHSLGYRVVGLYANGTRATAFVHRLVAEAFIGECAGRQINHLDGNKKNNAVGNLEITDAMGNMAHAVANGLVASGDRWRTPKQLAKIERSRGDAHWTRVHPERLARGERNGAVKYPERIERGEQRHCAILTADKVRHIRMLAAAGELPGVIAKSFGVTRKNIEYIVKRATWRHVE